MSRESIDAARERLRSIILSGVKVVTLSDNQTYDKASLDDVPKMIMPIMGMMRSHAESERKSEMLRMTWEQKRRIASQKPLTKQVPHWLEVDDEGVIRKRPDRVTVVKKIFNWYTEETCGYHTIVKRLNNDGIPIWDGRSKCKQWSLSSIKRIIKHISVIGQFQPHTISHEKVYDESGDFVKTKRVRTPVGEPIENYFPAIISKEQFIKASEIAISRPKYGGRTGAVSNLFVHLSTRGYCGGSIHYVNKGKKNKTWVYLNCHDARVGGNCDYVSVNYLKFEDAFLRFITELDVDQVVNDDEINEEVKEINAKLYNLIDLQNQKNKTKHGTKRLITALDEDESIKELVFEYKQIYDELKRLEAEISIGQSQLRRLTPPKHNVNKHLDMVRKLRVDTQFMGDSEKQVLRLKLRAAIADLVDRIVFYPNGLKDKMTEWGRSSIVVKDFFPWSWADLEWAENEGTEDHVKKAQKAIRAEKAAQRMNNYGKENVTVIIYLNGGYAHVLKYDKENDGFIQDIAYTEKYPIMIGDKPLDIGPGITNVPIKERKNK